MNDTNDGDGLLMPEPEPDPKKNRRPAPAATAEPKSESKGAASRAAAGADEDLSAEIARSVPRERGEQVTCRRITKHHYRCNWWRAQDLGAYDNPLMGGLLVTTNRICKSQFLRVMPAVGDASASGNSGRLSITVVPER